MKKYLFGFLVLTPLVAAASLRQECVFSNGSSPLFKTSIDVVGPKTFGDMLSIYSYDSGQILLYLGQSTSPRQNENFRLELMPNPSFKTFALSEMRVGDVAQGATLYFSSSAYGTSMSGTCKFVRP